MLPTALGNALRAAEDRAGNRYGLDSVTMWPRLVPSLSDSLSATLQDQRTQLDAGVRYTWVLTATALVTTALLAEHGGYWLLLPVVLSCLAWLAYQGAVRAGVRYGISLEVAFDLHRFDLMRALHLPLPTTPQQELTQNRHLTRWLAQGVPLSLPYDHGEQSQPPAPPSGPPDREPPPDR